MTQQSVTGGRRRRNVLVVVADILDEGAFDRPALAELAAKGTRFTHAYRTCADVIPAQAGVLYGRYPHELRMFDDASRQPAGVTSWLDLLAQAGFVTASFGTWQAVDEANATGSSRHCSRTIDPGATLEAVALRSSGMVVDDPAAPVAGVGTGELLLGAASAASIAPEAIADQACRWLAHVGETAAAQATDPEAPGFAAVVVLPTVSNEARLSRDAGDRGPAVPGIPDAWRHPTVEEFQLARANRSRLDVHGERFDDALGRLSGVLEESGQAHQTLVVVTALAGPARTVGDLVHPLAEASIRVPMVVAGPHVAAARSDDRAVSHVDIGATAVAHVASATPAAADLQSKCPPHGLVLVGDAATITEDRPVLVEFHGPGSVSVSVALRHGPLKYLEHLGFRQQLFDVVDDPGESLDRSRDPAYAEDLLAGARFVGEFFDPDLVDQAAKADQERRLVAHRDAAGAGRITGENIDRKGGIDTRESRSDETT